MAETLGSFGTFVAPEKSNPYADTFVEFAKASDKDPNVSWSVTLDASKETVERIQIAAAANAVGKTARLRDRDDSKRTVVGTREKSGNPVYAGEVTLTFTLSPMHAQRRGKDENGSATENAPADAPEKAEKAK